MQFLKGWRGGAEVPNSAVSEPKYGVKTLVDREDASLDIVLVHGLTGGREATWTHADSTFWPKDLLAADFPKARIMTFGYDANVAGLFRGQASNNTLRDHGRTLCSDLAMARLRSNSNDRPLIFIAHSLGGLVCEQVRGIHALVISSGAPEQYYQNILECTVGIIFMGTPHAGSDLTRWKHVLESLGKVATNVNSDITDVLEPGSQVLAGLQQEFHRLLARRAADGKSSIKILCVFEELPTTGLGMIVERQSAILAQYDCIGLHGNHKEIVKFGKDKAGYDRVRDRLWVWISIEGGEQSVQSNLTQRDVLGSQGHLSVPIYQLRQPKASSPRLTQERITSLANLTWQLYTSCDEISDLRPLCLGLGDLNLQLRKTCEHVSHGILDRAMQDMLLNVADGCYAILSNVEQQIKQYEKLEGSSVDDWNQVIWKEEEVRRRAAYFKLYGEALNAMNANFLSEIKLLVVRKFLSFVHDVKTGRAEWSALSQSLDYVTADDGESELIWKTLRHDLERTGISTYVIDKNRSLITAKFKVLVESGEVSRPAQLADEYATSGDDEEIASAVASMEERADLDGSLANLSNPAMFFAAARSGRVGAISKMIEGGTDANFQDASGSTALHLAASAGQEAVVRVLLSSGCDVSILDVEGWTALRYALSNGHHSVLKAILGHDSGSRAINEKFGDAGHTLLHFAANSGDEDAVVLLLQGGADANAQNRSGQTPLHSAAWRRDLIILSYLLDTDDIRLDIEDIWGDTALDLAIRSPITSIDKTAVVRVFLEAWRRKEGGYVGKDVDLDDVVKFLSMESIYDRGSTENIFKASKNGRSIAGLLPNQFEMNDLADDLFEAIYQTPSLTSFRQRQNN